MKLFGLYLENTFKIIFNKTVRAIFVPPVMRVTTFPASMSANPADMSVFGFYSYNIDYKNKFGYWEFASSPYIQINIFGAAVKITFEPPVQKDEVTPYGYWESILDVYCNYAYNNNDNFNLYKIIERNTWGKRDSRGNFIKDDMTRILTHRGAHRYYYSEGLYNEYKKYEVDKQ